ncbi:DUF6249 domain-containing protein [Granulicella tundricola]|uniref:DUF6249 domain-containing protein n=1 Tax=Granulicella tundricola (strain ATCC BAA-1859 / DSM 23138 / MP5ACTX9) TaxID=1198114 RepID=E8X2V8_GRATM|nr:DUF6249 domain-containing protein [Granulicella tundricola]ADW68092.1 hypothetical protein AciX9_1029 [Granulicella tundricola MP5ACTX9]
MLFSPFVVPLGAFLVAIVAIAGGLFSQAHARRVKADQRMAMLARGIPLVEIEAVLKTAKDEEERPVKDPMRSLGNARRTAVVLISSGLGLMLFFAVISFILHERDVMAGAAIGLIPLAIGLGFVVDYQLQKREMARFGLEIG